LRRTDHARCHGYNKNMMGCGAIVIEIICPCVYAKYGIT
jgi:hypothetical protein